MNIAVQKERDKKLAKELEYFSGSMCSVAHRERLAGWMTSNGFATGHGGTFDDLLGELTWQVKELRERELHWSVAEINTRATKLREEFEKP